MSEEIIQYAQAIRHAMSLSPLMLFEREKGGAYSVEIHMIRGFSDNDRGEFATAEDGATCTVFVQTGIDSTARIRVKGNATNFSNLLTTARDDFLRQVRYALHG